MSPDFDGMVTIPAAELRKIEAQMQEQERAMRNLQLFLFLELRDKGRARYSLSELENAKAAPFTIDVTQDDVTKAVAVSVRQEPVVDRPAPAPAHRQPQSARVLPRLVAVK